MSQDEYRRQVDARAAQVLEAIHERGRYSMWMASALLCRDEDQVHLIAREHGTVSLDHLSSWRAASSRALSPYNSSMGTKYRAAAKASRVAARISSLESSVSHACPCG